MLALWQSLSSDGAFSWVLGEWSGRRIDSTASAPPGGPSARAAFGGSPGLTCCHAGWCHRHPGARSGEWITFKAHLRKDGPMSEDPVRLRRDSAGSGQASGGPGGRARPGPGAGCAGMGGGAGVPRPGQAGPPAQAGVAPGHAMGAPYFAESFSPLPGRCFRLVGDDGSRPSHLPAGPAPSEHLTAAATRPRLATATGHPSERSTAPARRRWLEFLEQKSPPADRALRSGPAAARPRPHPDHHRTIPPGTDVARLSTVAVHCKVYSVDFGPGTLGPPTGATT
jgi:hypothetical protein